MTDQRDDPPVSERELAAWRQLDVLDPEPFGDRFFDDLARDIERAVATPPPRVIPLRSRRPRLIAGLALAAALLLGFGLLLRDPPAPTDESPSVAAAEEPTPSIEDIARALGASAVTAVLDGADEDDTLNLLATRSWTDDEDADLVPGSYGSLLEELDDLDDYDSFLSL